MSKKSNSIFNWANANAPFGCGDGVCDMIVTGTDYATERQLWIENCAAKNTAGISFRKNAIKANCQAEYDRLTQSMRYGTAETNFYQNQQVFDAAFNQETGKNELITYVVIFLIVGLLVYLYF